MIQGVRDGAGAERLSVDKTWVCRLSDRVHHEAEGDQAAELGSEEPPRAKLHEQGKEDRTVEKRPSVRRRAEQLGHAADNDGANDDAHDAAEAAEDHDRVDRDQQADVVVSRQRRRGDRAVDRSSKSGRTAAPQTNASSFSRLTGMLITSAARGSSRSARQARPVRESLTNMSKTKKTDTPISRK